MLLALALACSGCNSLDPELEPHREALAAFEKGEKALDAGDLVAARAAFQEAQKHRPDDVLLKAWEARVAASQGDLDTAIALLDNVLRRRPGFSEARYNRAAYMARRGDKPERTAADLKQAVADGARKPRDVLADPDFKPYLDHSAFQFLPDSPLTVAVDAPQEVVFLGSEVSFRFRVQGADDVVISVTAEQSQGPIALVSVVEDQLQSSDGPVRDLTWTVRAVGAGAARIGPFHVWAGDFQRVVQAVSFECKAPPGRETPDTPPAPLDLTTPRELVGTQKPPAVWLRDSDLLVLTGSQEQVTVMPPPPSKIRYELRTGGQLDWTTRRYRDPGSPVVTVKRGSEVLFKGKAE